MNIKNAQSLWGGIPAVTWESASVKGDAISEQWTRVPAYLTQYWFPSQHIIRKSPGSPPGVWIVRVKWKRLCHILSLYFKHDLHWIRMKCWGREKGERSAQWHAEPRWAVCIRIYIGFCASMVIPHHCEPLFPGPMPAEEKIKIESRPSTVRRKKDNHTQLRSTEWVCGFQWEFLYPTFCPNRIKKCASHGHYLGFRRAGGRGGDEGTWISVSPWKKIMGSLLFVPVCGLNILPAHKAFVKDNNRGSKLTFLSFLPVRSQRPQVDFFRICLAVTEMGNNLQKLLK